MVLIVPTVEFPPGIESTSQFTLVLVLPVTAAAKVCACWVVRPARFGLTVTATVPVDWAVMVMVVTAVLAVLATDVAVRVTVAGFGTVAGAV